MWTKLWKEVGSLHLKGTQLQAPVSASELAALPPPVRAYLAFFDVTAGQPRHWSMCTAWKGRFRTSPRARWMPVDAVQYDVRDPVARVFHLRGRMGGLPVLARDTYVAGRGHLKVKLAGLVTVAEGSGPEFDVSELVTWVNDAILLAPSMLLGPRTRWLEVDAHTFDLAFTDRGLTVHGRVFLDERGAPVDFETADRYLNDPSDPRHRLVRGRWSTPIKSWTFAGKQPLPRGGTALWHLPESDFRYIEIEPVPGSLAFDRLAHPPPARG